MKQINNNIQETLVGFEVAKLLKEAGFGVWCQYKLTDFDGIEILEEDASEIFPYVPTQQLAIDWIRVNYFIDILVLPQDKSYNDPYPIYFLAIFEYKGEDRIEHWNSSSNNYNFLHFETPEEAKEAALEYCLTNLILKQ